MFESFDLTVFIDYATGCRSESVKLTMCKFAMPGVTHLKTTILTVAVLGLALTLPVNLNAGVVEKAFNGVEFGSSPDAVIQRIEDQCSSVETLNVESPVIPIAARQETHVLCKQFKSGEESQVAEVVFVFGDESLEMIEARGGVVLTLSALASAEPMPFQDYVVYMDDLMVTQTVEDAAWLLTPTSVHPHMFLWRNPVLTANVASAREFNASADIPEVLKFGASFDELKPLLEKNCNMTSVQQIEEVWLPTGPEKQTQINCYGYDYAGFTRKIEVIFGDGILQVAWILTGKGEEDRLRQSLLKEFGPSLSDNGTYEVFNHGRVALRKDKPEVLMLAEDLVPFYREDFAGGQ